MKPIGESRKVFQAYAMIDLCHFMLENLSKEYDDNKPKHPIEVLIDQQTGFAESRSKYYAEKAHSIMEELIRNKQIIEADTTKDMEMLDKLVQIHPELLNDK